MLHYLTMFSAILLQFLTGNLLKTDAKFTEFALIHLNKYLENISIFTEDIKRN